MKLAVPDISIDKRNIHAIKQNVRRGYIDQSGDTIVEANAKLSARAITAPGVYWPYEDILLRYDSSGKLKEEWRFAESPFAFRYSEIVTDSDGSVYYLRYGETGIDVVKYYRDKK